MRLRSITESMTGPNLASASPTDTQQQDEIDLTNPALENQPEMGQEPPEPSAIDTNVMAQANTMQAGQQQIPPQLKQLDRAFDSALKGASPAAMGKWIMARTRNIQQPGVMP